MKTSLLVFIITISVVAARAEVIMKIVSGKSLGNITLGSTSAALKKEGFLEDASQSSPDSYMKKGPLLVRLVLHRAVQIWYDSRALNKLTFQGRKLPRDGDIETFKKFFQGCEEFQGSGGKILYCENRGIELTFSYEPSTHGHPTGFSVILPSEVETLVKPKGI